MSHRLRGNGLLGTKRSLFVCVFTNDVNLNILTTFLRHCLAILSSSPADDLSVLLVITTSGSILQLSFDLQHCKGSFFPYFTAPQQAPAWGTSLLPRSSHQDVHSS